MRLEFVKAFVEITQTVFVEALGTTVETGRVHLESAPRAENTVITLIELSGELAGKIYLHLDMPTAVSISERMVGRNNLPRTLVASCIAELTSMAVGQAISWINDQDCHIDMSPPIVTMETQLKMPTNEVETLVFPVKTGCGDAILNISVIDLNYSAADEVVKE
jgi:CheY-specific phosphatase CheX